jgi:hypothetical protein
VKISGNGTLEDFVFPAFEIDGVTVYSDDAEVVTDLNESTVRSTYSKSFAFISDNDFTIPARRISVYDTKDKTVKYLEIPSYAVHVEGSLVQTEKKPQVKIADADKAERDLKAPQKSMLDTGEEYNNIPEEQSPPWWMIVSAFVSGLLLMYLLHSFSSLKRKRNRGTVNEDEALKILYAIINESKEVEDMVRKLYAKKNGDKSIVIDETVLKKLLEKYETGSDNG